MTLAFKDTVLTNKGFSISNKAALGKTQFSIFKAVSTDSDLTGYKIEDLKNLTSLPNEIESGTLSDYDSPESSISVIKMNFDNSKFQKGYTVRAIGLYGKDIDGNVFLHSLTVSDTPIVIPEVTGNIFDGLNHSITIFSGDNHKMNVDLEQQGAASVHYVDQSIQKISDGIKNDIQPSLDGKVSKEESNNKFTQLNQNIEDAENRSKKYYDDRLKFFNSLNDLNNATAPEGTIAIVKGG